MCSLSLSLSIFFPNPLIRVHAFVFDSVGSDGGMDSIASEVLNYGDANLRWICAKKEMDYNWFVTIVASFSFPSRHFLFYFYKLPSLYILALSDK
jgi:hypothetical protein